jgi:small subunit ribosomal protein S16
VLKIRLQRMGRRNAPHYRLVVCDIRRKRQGAYLENLGHYHPSMKDTDKFSIHIERIKHYLGLGAQISEAVSNLLEQQGVKVKQLVTECRQASAKAS